MTKSQLNGNIISKSKRGKKTGQTTKITYKRSIGKRINKELRLASKNSDNLTLHRNTVYLPEFEDYDPLWHIQRQNPTLFA